MSIVQGARQWFVDFLKNNLNYLDSNLIVEKNIDKSVIDLLIVENNSSEFFPLAIVEFKNLNSSIENTEQQVEKYRELIGKRNLPCFLIHGEEVYVLQSYGWQRIMIKDFPNLEKLK